MEKGGCDMIKVDSSNLGNCKKILYDDCPSFSGIVVKESKGDVWVNDLEFPTLAIVYSEPVGGYAILGTVASDEEFHHFVEWIDLDLISRETSYFEFSVEDKSLEQRLINYYKNKPLLKEQEYFYRINNYVDDVICPYYDVQLIDDVIAGELEHHKHFSSIILETWETYEDFLERSLGYVALDGNEVVGFIIGSSRFHDTLPINIKVLKEHRQKNIAAKLAEVFVNNCLDQGLIPQWNCVKSNIASIKTAEKIGFKMFKKSYYYYFSIK